MNTVILVAGFNDSNKMQSDIKQMDKVDLNVDRKVSADETQCL